MVPNSQSNQDFLIYYTIALILFISIDDCQVQCHYPNQNFVVSRDMHSILFHNAETVAASENQCILEIRSNIRHDFE